MPVRRNISGVVPGNLCRDRILQKTGVDLKWRFVGMYSWVEALFWGAGNWKARGTPPHACRVGRAVCFQVSRPSKWTNNTFARQQRVASDRRPFFLENSAPRVNLSVQDALKFSRLSFIVLRAVSSAPVVLARSTFEIGRKKKKKNANETGPIPWSSFVRAVGFFFFFFHEHEPTNS